ncbi:hypothetical protein [Pseudomonas sp.]|uniref:hypothetical protein n=1 Tax=Pseudomonas sp. TaxID=306 RepID=UPI002B9A3071|nr:hypothetical protein [Pseudomonas sp.]
MQPGEERRLLLMFSTVHGQLRAAMEARDWERFAAIDQRVRECLDALSACAEPSTEVLQAKQLLKELYGAALAGCAEACEKLRQVLLTHLEYVEGRSAYQRIDLYQGGR